MDIKKNNYTFAIAFRNESMYLITSYHGEMVEWSITTVLKTVVPRGTGGSNPSLSASKGVNQQVMRFTPFSTPKNIAFRIFFETNLSEKVCKAHICIS